MHGYQDMSPRLSELSGVPVWRIVNTESVREFTLADAQLFDYRYLGTMIWFD